MSRKNSCSSVTQSQSYYCGPAGNGREVATYVAFDIRALTDLMPYG